MLFRQLLTSTITVILTFALLSCGGGGGSDGEDQTKPLTTTTLTASISNLQSEAEITWQGQTLSLAANQTALSHSIENISYDEALSTTFSGPTFQNCLISESTILNSSEQLTINCSDPSSHRLTITAGNLRGELSIQWGDQTLVLNEGQTTVSSDYTAPDVVVPTIETQPASQVCSGELPDLTQGVATWALACLTDQVSHRINLASPLYFPVTVTIGEQTLRVQNESIAFEALDSVLEDVKMAHLGGTQNCVLTRGELTQDADAQHSVQTWDLQCAGFAVVPVPQGRLNLNGEKTASGRDRLLWVGQSKDIAHRVLLDEGFDINAIKTLTLGNQHYVVDTVLGVRELMFDGGDLANPTDVTLQPLADFPVDNQVTDFYATYDALYLKTESNDFEVVYRLDDQGQVKRLLSANAINIEPVDDYNDEVALVRETQVSDRIHRTTANHFLKGQAVFTHNLHLRMNTPSLQVSSLLNKNNKDIGLALALGAPPLLSQLNISLDSFADPVEVGTFDNALNMKKWPDSNGDTKVWLNANRIDLNNGDVVSLAQFDVESTGNQIDTQVLAVDDYDSTPTILGMDSHSWLSATLQDNGVYGLKAFNSRWYGPFDNNGWFPVSDGHSYVQYRKIPINDAGTIHRTEITTNNGWILVWRTSIPLTLDLGIVHLFDGNDMRPTKDSIVFAGISHADFLNEKLVVATPYLRAVMFKGELLIFHREDLNR